MPSLSPARWAYRRRAPTNFCMRMVSHRFGSAAGWSCRRSSFVREAHMKNKYLSARVSRVSRLCPIFRAQPGAYPPEARRPDVAPTCGSVAGMPSAEENRLRVAFSRGRSRKRRSRINGWRRNRRFSWSQQPAVRTVSRGCAGAAIGACLEKNKRGWHQKSHKCRVFGYLARFFILFQTEKSSREVVIS